MPRTDATARASRKRKPRRPGDTDRVRALVAMPRIQTPKPLRRQARTARQIEDAARSGRPRTGGAYPGADTSPLPRVTWRVPADRCAALTAIRNVWTHDVDEAELNELRQFVALQESPRLLARALHHAPLPEWLAAALWQRCPRADDRMWRWTDTLSEDDAARLEGGVPCGGMGCGAPGCVGCHDGYVYPNGRGIPVGSRLVRLAPGSAGRMLALAMAICDVCMGQRVVGRMLLTQGGVMPRAPRECPACAGTGTVPLATIRERGE